MIPPNWHPERNDRTIKLRRHLPFDTRVFPGLAVFAQSRQCRMCRGPGSPYSDPSPPPIARARLDHPLDHHLGLQQPQPH